MNIGSQKAGTSTNNYSGGNINTGSKKRIDDIGSVFIEVPEEELSQLKSEKMELRACLVFAKEMMVCNDVVLPRTFEKIDKVLKETI